MFIVQVYLCHKDTLFFPYLTGCSSKKILCLPFVHRVLVRIEADTDLYQISAKGSNIHISVSCKPSALKVTIYASLLSKSNLYTATFRQIISCINDIICRLRLFFLVLRPIALTDDWHVLSKKKAVKDDRP